MFGSTLSTVTSETRGRRCNVLVLVLGLLLMLLSAPAATAQTPMRVTASINDDGMTEFGRFEVPLGMVARDFRARMTSPGFGIGGGLARPSMAITSAGGARIFFSREPVSGGMTQDAPVPLADLVLQPGTYEVRPGGGKRTHVTVEFVLTTPTAQPGEGSITAIIDSDCQVETATLMVPPGMKAVDLWHQTHSSGLPCTPGTTSPPYGMSLAGPGVNYLWEMRGTQRYESPGPLGDIELMPGTYTLRAGGGKLSSATLHYELMPIGDADPPADLTLPPSVWEPVTEGQGSAWIDGDNLEIDSMGPAAAWFRTLRPYRLDQDYVVEFDFRMTERDNHWVTLYSDGFVYVNIDWGLHLNHIQPGASYDTVTVATLDEDRWYTLRIEASPGAGTFKLFLNGTLAGTATGIEPHRVEDGKGPDTIWFGDGDSLAYQGGGYNRGRARFRYFRVRAGVAADPVTDLLPSMADAGVYAYEYRNWHRANSGLYSTMGAGYHPTGGEKRAYLRFDVPPGLSFDRAVLRVWVYGVGGSPGLQLGAHEVTSDWLEGTDTYHSGEVERTAPPGEVTWVQQPTFAPTPVATAQPPAPGWLQLDITPLVRKWAQGAPNNGLVLKGVPPFGGESMYNLFARERQEDPDKRPHIAIDPS